MTEQRRQGHDGEHREHEQQRVRFRFELVTREYGRDESQQPQQRVVPDFLEQRIHGFNLV